MSSTLYSSLVSTFLKLFIWESIQVTNIRDGTVFWEFFPLKLLRKKLKLCHCNVYNLTINSLRKIYSKKFHCENYTLENYVTTKLTTNKKVFHCETSTLKWFHCEIYTLKIISLWNIHSKMISLLRSKNDFTAKHPL